MSSAIFQDKGGTGMDRMDGRGFYSILRYFFKSAAFEKTTKRLTEEVVIPR